MCCLQGLGRGHRHCTDRDCRKDRAKSNTYKGCAFAPQQRSPPNSTHALRKLIEHHQ
jgi:hypothetical protein